MTPIMGIIALIKDGGKGKFSTFAEHKNQISFDIELEDC